MSRKVGDLPLSEYWSDVLGAAPAVFTRVAGWISFPGQPCAAACARDVSCDCIHSFRPVGRGARIAGALSQYGRCLGEGGGVVLVMPSSPKLPVILSTWANSVAAILSTVNTTSDLNSCNESSDKAILNGQLRDIGKGTT